MSTKWIIVFFLIFASICSYAQPKEYFDLPPSIPKPSWFNQIDWKNINVFRSDSIVQKYKEEERSKNPNKKEEFEEDPYLTAYRRWRMNIQPYIKPDGGLDLSPKKIQIRSSSIKLQGLSAGSWTCLGPVETFEGEDPNRSGKAIDSQVNIYTLAIDPNNSNTLYCGSETGIIFKSPDKGLHWTSVSDQLTLPGAPTAIAIAKKTPNTIFCYAGQLIKSSDGGTTWSQVATYPGNGSEAIQINPTTDRIYVASREGSTKLGVYISDNKGQTWSIANGTSGIAIDDIAINPANNNIVYAVGKNSSQGLVLFTSTDGGTNFTNKTGSLSMINKGARIGITPANGNILYCIVLSNSNPTVLLKSTNAGQTWSTHVSSKCASWAGCNTNGVGLGMGGGQGFYDLAILVSTQDANKIIVGDSSSFISTDGGSNFTGLGSYVGSWPMHPDYQSMAMDGNDTFIANDGGIIYSSDFFTNQANFDSRNNGLTGSPFWGFSQGWDEDLVVGGRYHNGNMSLFEQSGSGGSMALGGGEDDTGHVLHGYSMTAAFHDIGTKVVPSTLNGTATEANIQNTQWPNSDYYGAFSSRLVTDPRYRTILYLGGNKDLAAENTTLWKSINSGQSYTSLHTFPSKVWRFDISRSNPKILFVCTTDGVYKTSDAGNTWANITQNIGVTYEYYNSDIVIDPSNANTIFLAMAQGNNQNKVFRSTDGGDSWTNYTGAGLAGLSVAFLQADGTKEGIYAITKNNPTQVFYRNSTMTDWINFSNGIPANFEIWPGGAIFFRDDKIRIAGNRGIWESPLHAHPNPIAQPMADKQYVACGNEVVTFNDYSILNYNGVNLKPAKAASWKWNLPGATYVNGTSSTSQKPQVTYSIQGSYTVTLAVTDGLGLSHTHTVPNMITMLPNQCSPEPIAGKALIVSNNMGARTEINTGPVSINSNNFTISCWMKPNGLQKSFSQLISHDPYPGSESGFGLGFPFNNYNPSLNLCYTDNIVGYGNSSSLIATDGQWNFVVLAYAPTGVTIYLNGEGEVVNNQSMPKIDLSQTPFYINRDIHGQEGDFNGQIDEVKFYNYALSKDEVREKMHLIAEPSVGEMGLISYYQFNQYEPKSSVVYDVISKFPASVPAGSITISTAPIATGTSYRLSDVTTNGPFSLGNTSITLQFSSSPYPNDDIVAYRLNGLPYGLSPTVNTANNHWIIRYWGTNTFKRLSNITFRGIPVSTSDAKNPSIFCLYQRPANSFDSSSWMPACTANAATAGVKNGLISYYGNSCTITAFSNQFIIPTISAITGTTNTAVGCSTPLSNITTGGTWSSSNSSIADVDNLGVVKGIGIGSATITYTIIDNSMTLTTAVIVTVGLLPVPTIIANRTTTLCQGESVILSSSPANGYLWSNGEKTQSITVSSAGIYSVAISNTCGNSVTSAPITITVNPLTPPPTISANGPITFCQGGSVMLTSSRPANNYLWSNGEKTQTITVSSSGNYSVTTNSGGCSTSSDATKVTVNPLPSIPTISANGAVLTSSSADNNQWYLNGSIISGATSQDYTMTTLGTYTVVVTNDNGCSASSIPYNTTDDDFIIYPNPNDGQFRIQKPATMQIIELKIYNMFGHLMYQSKTGETNLNLQGLNGGAYVLEIKTGGKTYKAKKFIVQ